MNGIVYAIGFVVLLLVIERVPSIIINWVLVNKAGKPGWSQVVPFYAALTRADIAGGLGLAIGLMISEPILYVVLLIGLTVPDVATFCIILGVILLVVSYILWSALNIRFATKYVVVDKNGVPTRQLRLRSSLFLLFYLRNIQYRSEGFVASNPTSIESTRMLGYEKTDYLPAGFDGVAIVAVWTSIFALPILPVAPFAFVLGIIALFRIKQHPERKGRGRAWFAIVWGVLWSAALAFVIYYLAIHMPNP